MNFSTLDRKKSSVWKNVAISMTGAVPRIEGGKGVGAKWKREGALIMILPRLEEKGPYSGEAMKRLWLSMLSQSLIWDLG